MASSEAEAEKTWYVYILRLSNGHLYTGYTDDVDRRIATHASGNGARCTRSFPPVLIERVWTIAGGKSSAMRIEAFIKSLARGEKDDIIMKPSLLPELFRSRKGLDSGAVVVRKYTRKRVAR